MNKTVIIQSCERNSLRWTNHVAVRLTQRNISADDIVITLINGEIIEEYPDDYPYPSCLVNGRMRNDQPLHVVCGFGEGELWLITAYHPDAEEWTPGFTARREMKSQ